MEIAAAEPALKLPAGHRAIWWIADNEEELTTWKEGFARHGVLLHKTEPHPAPSTMIDVIFSLDPAHAVTALGYVPEESEWLEQ
jgi:hypothetical protein